MSDEDQKKYIEMTFVCSHCGHRPEPVKYANNAIYFVMTDFKCTKCDAGRYNPLVNWENTLEELGVNEEESDA